MVKLPDEEFVSGDGWSATYRFNGRNYITGHTIASEVRKNPSIKVKTGNPLAVPTIQSSMDGDDTEIILSLSGEQTRALGGGGVLDIQVTPTGGDPLTLVQQRLVAEGDVTA